MQCVVQRVRHAQVDVDCATVGSIGQGLVVLVGIADSDSPEDVRWMANKLVRLRIFDDDQGKFDRSVLDVGGSILSVSQFTLLGDARKGTRPSFTRAAAPDVARVMWESFNTAVAEHGVPVATGQFAAHMHVSLLNDGPVTVLLER